MSRLLAILIFIPLLAFGATTNTVTTTKIVATEARITNGTFSNISTNTIKSGTLTTLNALVTANSPYYTKAINFANLSSAKVAIGSSKRVLVVTTDMAVNNLTLPDNIKVLFTPGGSFNIASGKTVNVLGEIEAGRWKIVNGSGTLNLNSSQHKVVNPEWWSTTGGIKEAVSSAGLVAKIDLARKNYTEDNTIPTVRGLRISGIQGEVNNGTYTGTMITYTGNGDLFKMGADDSQPWDSGLYNGPQGLDIENVAFYASSGTTTPLQNGDGRVYATGSYAIRDWRGGHVRLKNVVFQRFEYGFWGVNSDIDTLENIETRDCKVGLYFGPKSDQFYVANHYSTTCDQAFVSDGCSGQIISPKYVGDGYHGVYPVEILQSTTTGRVVDIIDPWVEAYQSAADYINAFIGVGVNTGYNGGTGANRVLIKGAHINQGAQGIGTGYAKYLVEVGKGFTEIEGIYGQVYNIAAVANFVGNYTSATSSATVVAQDFGLTWFRTSEASGTYAYMFTGRGSSYPKFMSIGGRLYIESGSDHTKDYMFTPEFGGLVVQQYNAATDNLNLVKILNRYQEGSSWPTSGTWNTGDRFYNSSVTSGVCAKKVNVGGTEGTYTEGRTATTNGTNTVALNMATTVLKKGQFIRIVGAGTAGANFDTSILSVAANGLSIVVGDTPPTNVTGAAISFRAPTWGNLWSVTP